MVNVGILFQGHACVSGFQDWQDAAGVDYDIEFDRGMGEIQPLGGWDPTPNVGTTDLVIDADVSH